MEETKIVMYGAPWCADCRRSKKVFEELEVEYEYIDIDAVPAAADKVAEINGGNQSIPTIVFPDGDVMVEPSDNELRGKLERMQRK